MKGIRQMGLALALALALGGCTPQIQRSDADAQSCAREPRLGRLHVAEGLCQRALDGQDGLTPEVRSQQLFALAQIKRQRGKYAEARALLEESLTIEQASTGPASAGAARRLLEQALVDAGLGQWPRGAEALERALPLAPQLSAAERASLAHIVPRYVTQLRQSGATAAAGRLEGGWAAAHPADTGDGRSAEQARTGD